jgi:predicted DNA-binding ribbon-helix-helix protein
MKSPVVKRSIVVAGHKTSVSLEEAFWSGMKEISGLRSMTLSELVGEIDTNRQQGNLSSAIRLFVLDHFKTRTAPTMTVVPLSPCSATADSGPAQPAHAGKTVVPLHLRS